MSDLLHMAERGRVHYTIHCPEPGARSPEPHIMLFWRPLNYHQESQGRGECFGRITIEAMSFQLPVLGTADGGTTEIIVDGLTGLLNPVGKEGVGPLAKNIVTLATHVERRLSMGKEGYRRVKERFMEHHMSERIASVFKEVLQNRSA